MDKLTAEEIAEKEQWRNHEIDETGARRLVAAILKQAHDDIKNDESCPAWCEYKDTCQRVKVNEAYCDAKKFIHSAWCAALCDGIDIDQHKYMMVCIEKHRLSKNTYRYVENEIKSYKNNKKELEQFKKDIILSTPIKQEGRGSEVGDTTAHKAIKISMSKKIANMERHIKAVEKVHGMLDKNKKLLMQEMWLNRYTSNGLADALCVSERTIYYWKKYIVYSVAKELNYL